jgi:trehalose synthase
MAQFDLVEDPPPIGQRDLSASPVDASNSRCEVLDVTVGETEGGLAVLLRSEMRHGRTSGMQRRWVRLPMPNVRAYRAASTLHMLAYGAAPDLPANDTEIRRALYDDIPAIAPIAELEGGGAQVAILHDAHTLGFAPLLARRGYRVIWRFHLGTDEWNEHTERHWSLITELLSCCDAIITHSYKFVPALTCESIHEIRPGVDATSVRNTTRLEPHYARKRLCADRRGIEIHTPDTDDLEAADVLLVQLARWAPLKDPCGALRVAAAVLAAHPRASVLIAGSRSSAPSAIQTRAAATALRDSMPPSIRRRIHLWSLEADPQAGGEQLAGLVQCAGDIHLAMSRAEGYGLAVTEAMWKSKPVVGRAVGGIARQLGCCNAGYIATTERELASFALQLAADHNLRSELGLRARACAEAHSSIECDVAQIAAVVENLSIASPSRLQSR